jgi:hypothetical protein
VGGGSPGGRTTALNGERKSVTLLVTAGRRYEVGGGEERGKKSTPYKTQITVCLDAAAIGVGTSVL